MASTIQPSISLKLHVRLILTVSEESCPVRNSLSRAATAAITETYRANLEYDQANMKGMGHSNAMAYVLYLAMKAEDAAIEALHVHIAQHDGCEP